MVKSFGSPVTIDVDFPPDIINKDLFTIRLLNESFYIALLHFNHIMKFKRLDKKVPQPHYEQFFREVNDIEKHITILSERIDNLLGRDISDIGNIEQVQILGGIKTFQLWSKLFISLFENIHKNRNADVVAEVERLKDEISSQHDTIVELSEEIGDTMFRYEQGKYE